MKIMNHRAGDVRLTIRDMRCRDWRRLSGILAGILPEFDSQDEFQRALTGLAWCEGFKKLNGDISEEGCKPLRLIRRALANGPFQSGVFRLERSGRWEVVFVISPEYAAERAPRRRRRSGLDALSRGFEKDFRRRSKAHAEAGCQ